MVTVSEVLALLDQLLNGTLSEMSNNIRAIQLKAPPEYRSFVFSLLVNFIALGEDVAKTSCIPLVILLCPRQLNESGMLSLEAAITINTWLENRKNQ